MWLKYLHGSEMIQTTRSWFNPQQLPAVEFISTIQLRGRCSLWWHKLAKFRAHVPLTSTLQPQLLFSSFFYLKWGLRIASLATSSSQSLGWPWPPVSPPLRLLKCWDCPCNSMPSYLIDQINPRGCACAYARVHRHAIIGHLWESGFSFQHVRWIQVGRSGSKCYFLRHPIHTPSSKEEAVPEPLLMVKWKLMAELDWNSSLFLGYLAFSPPQGLLCSGLTSGKGASVLQAVTLKHSCKRRSPDNDIFCWTWN